jgi:hypothetical protein
MILAALREMHERQLAAIKQALAAARPKAASPGPK